MPRSFRTPLLILAVIIVLALVGVLVVFTGQTPPHPPLPNPNGYDDFLKAAAVATTSALALDHDGLAALVSTNAETLRLLRLGLTRGCSVPTDSAMTNIAGMPGDLARLKSLVRLLTEEGRLAEMEGRYGDAAQSYVDAIRFGNEISRGGFIIHRLVGIACEALGCGPLAKLLPNLKPDQARSVITTLDKIDSARVTWDEIRRNENRFSRHQLLKGFNPIAWATTRWQFWRSTQQAAGRHKLIMARERLLAAELGLRGYQLEQGHSPARLDELVTNYLSTVPRDPFTDQPMIYRRQGTNWLVYSVGPDAVDDGGRPAGQGWPMKGDLRFDSP